MRIIICGSISAALEILKARDELVKMGYEVEIPFGVKHEYYRTRTELSDHERAGDKIEHDLIRSYYEKMKDFDIVLIVNPDKRGIKNYIGGNTFIEMAFAHVLNKKLYCLYHLPDMPYKAEMLALQPVVLNGDLDKLCQ